MIALKTFRDVLLTKLIYQLKECNTYKLFCFSPAGVFYFNKLYLFKSKFNLSFEFNKKKKRRQTHYCYFIILLAT